MTYSGKVCKHGSLKRQCLVCELEERLRFEEQRSADLQRDLNISIARDCLQCEAYAKEIEKVSIEMMQALGKADRFKQALESILTHMEITTEDTKQSAVWDIVKAALSMKYE